MYELRPESIRTFITDPTIDLPRFQRKSTWTPKQNFNLALSVFRGFPVGVFVIKKDLVDGKAKRFLLDGRQRRNALKLMQDPEELYAWARAALRFKSTSDPDEIATAFGTYLQTFLGEEDWERQVATPQESAAQLESELGAVGDFDLGEYLDNGSEAAVEPEADGDDENDGTTDATSQPLSTHDMSALLRTVLSVHPMRGRTSAITRLFDYRQWIEGTPYSRIDGADGKDYITGRQVVNWLEFKRRSNESAEFPGSSDVLVDWLLEHARLTPTKSEGSLRAEAALRWERTANVFKVLQRLEELSQEGVIGYLEIRDSSPNDERKIFEIINTAGTPLTAVEILSARPAWNDTVLDPNETLLRDVRLLYERMGLTFDGRVVKWDVPATLMTRIDAPVIFGRLGADDPRAFERRLTLGFKLLSGHHAGNITKDEIATLASKPNLGITWATTEFDDFIGRAVARLMDVGALKFWNSWNLSLLGATSDAVALNYVLTILRDWKRLAPPPNPAAAAFRKFARNAVVLLDRSVFEYVNGDWRGSSDSRIASNLKDIDKWELAEPVAEDRWRGLVDGVIDEGRINDQAYTGRVDPRIVTLLYYRNVILERLGPGNPSVAIHVDHIIPRTQFETELDAAVKLNMHHISNLALLPQKENQQKSGRLLNQVQDPYLRAQIAKLEDVGEEDFGKFSSSSTSPELREQRGAMIREDLTTRRSTMLKSLS